MFILKDIVYTCTGMKLKACFNKVARHAQWMFDFVSMALKRFPFLDQSSFNVALKSIIQHKNWSWYTGLQSSIFPKWLNTISWNDKDILLVNQVIWMQSVALNFDSLNSYFGWVLKLYNTFVRSIGSCFDFCIGGGHFYKDPWEWHTFSQYFDFLSIPKGWLASIYLVYKICSPVLQIERLFSDLWLNLFTCTFIIGF